MKKVNLLLVFLMFSVSLLLFSKLPDLIPIHWNIQGQIDNYSSKSIGAWLLPILTVVMLILFRVVPSFDPKKEKYRLFKKEWEIIQAGFVGFFAYLQFVILYISLNPGINMLPLMFIGIGSLFVLLGNYLSKIRQNYFIGIKVPWTLNSEDNWNKTHRFASWCFVVAGIVTITEAYFFWFAPIVILGSIFLAIIMPIIYSFLLFKKMPDKMKYIFLFLIIVAGTLFLIRLFSGEDDWICQNGQWVKHGQPSAPTPQSKCR